MAEHKHGSMDSSDHEKTFNGFMKLAGRVAFGCLLFLAFLALVNG